ncbi:MAG: hypothetical protein ACOYBV_01315 [Candidatus Avilachnospira sp.]
MTMIFIGGVGNGVKELTKDVYMTYLYFSFFFIPLFKWNKRYFLRNTEGGADMELPREIGRQIERGEEIAMLNFSQMSQLMEMKALSDRFFANHPKLMPFLKAVSDSGVREGSVIEISVKEPSGREYVTNLKITEDDMMCFEKLKNMKQGQ